MIYIYRQLFKNQGDYFDIPSSTLTPIQIREMLAKLAAEVIPSDKVDEVCKNYVLNITVIELSSIS